MNKTFVCDVSKEDSKELLGLFEMKNTLESLVLQIANNNDILKEDSLLYARLVEDYKENISNYNKFWSSYHEKYGHLLNKDTQLSMDFNENKLYIIPIENIAPC